MKEDSGSRCGASSELGSEVGLEYTQNASESYKLALSAPTRSQKMVD